MSFDPTPEQTNARDLYLTGDSLAITAGAGAGKTSTLKILAEATPKKRIQFTAFNKAIVVDAGSRFPSNTACNTAHSLAMGAVGRTYRHRLDTGRMRSDQIARQLGIDPLVVTVEGEGKRLAPGFLAGHVMAAVTRFCQSADLAPGVEHFGYIDGIDMPAGDGRRTWANNDLVRDHLLPSLRKAWADLKNPDGRLPYKHDHYLKAWQLDGPKIHADVILVDEAQDLNPVLAAIVAAQDHAQLVYVGDENQQLYAWTGAVNALAHVPVDLRCSLTQSFRFGPAVAEVANRVLAQLGASLRIQGFDPIDSRVGPVTDPRVILTRTNATAVATALRALRDGRTVHLVGGGTEVASFAKAAHDLQEKGETWHRELACFSSWGQVQDYCLAPTTRVLTTDLRWVPIGLVEPGDTLLGFEEENTPGQGGRRYRTVKVESVKPIVRPSVRITAEDGTEVVASVEHRWLVRSGGNLRWKRAGRLAAGDQIVSVGQPTTQEETFDAGWLAGMFDGEGCLVGRSTSTWSKTRAVSIGQNPGPVLDRVCDLLTERGFIFGIYGTDSRAQQVWLQGGLAEQIRLLSLLRPGRLIEKAERLWDGLRVESRTVATVAEVEYLGDQHVVAVQTDGRTFVAEGWLSHNCENDPQGSELKLLVDLIDTYGADVIVDALGRMTPEARAQLTISTAHKSKGREWASVQLADDFPEPDDGPLEAPELMLLYVAATRARLHLDITKVPALTAPAPVASATGEPTESPY